MGGKISRPWGMWTVNKTNESLTRLDKRLLTIGRTVAENWTKDCWRLDERLCRVATVMMILIDMSPCLSPFQYWPKKTMSGINFKVYTSVHLCIEQNFEKSPYLLTLTLCCCVRSMSPYLLTLTLCCCVRSQFILIYLL